MRKRNFDIDFVEFFAYSIYGSPCEIAPLGLLLRRISQGKFFEGVHHFSHGPGGSGYFCPDYPFNLSLKSFLSG